jgi:hypothetical protein
MTEVASGYFPDYDVQWDVKVGRRYKTQITEAANGSEQRRRMFPAPASRGTGIKGGYGFVTASSDAFNPTEREAVASFLDSLEGSFRAFYWFRKDRDNFTNYEVGSVAAQSSIVIPFKDASVTSVTVANVSKAFTVTSGVGTGGEDRINFTAGIQTGVVRVTLRGRERWLVRCANDEVIEGFVANVVSDNVVVQLAFNQVG